MSTIKNFANKVRNLSTTQKFKKLNNDNLVVKNSLGLSLVVFGVLIFSPLAKDGDANKLILIGMYLIVIAMCVMVILDFFIKVLKLQNEKKVNRYSAIVAINSFFGLVIPLIFTNFLLNKSIIWLKHVKSFGTVVCDIRHEIIDMYFNYGIYGFLYNVITWTLVLTIALFLFGHLFERQK